ncbi:hypothetical protein FA95DRAFT_815884 [Auriscalpium vulgare]|uniref:Uncharacterized protein n=1 Tax=Auriscalpium vulgare TaxID=40419 RepID=A0ACB8RZL3_9AGAM|nr:hypothetical protein FA95DRAFT_815884 [Auriscalpium vulgare]
MVGLGMTGGGGGRPVSEGGDIRFHAGDGLCEGRRRTDWEINRRVRARATCRSLGASRGRGSCTFHARAVGFYFAEGEHDDTPAHAVVAHDLRRKHEGGDEQTAAGRALRAAALMCWRMYSAAKVTEVACSRVRCRMKCSSHGLGMFMVGLAVRRERWMTGFLDDEKNCLW